ncbi:hypothetical protein D5F51_21120 [Yersinia hibernica]|uniref:Uncharacterized protein n=2 Tax=Yersinia TaxID=629 RepID=A0ABX5R603_9GAMM|nr:hypothetical protein LC20_06360 [Yersinia hibernica]OVZ91964.1 hypothetical protein CBW54_04605 [Yersinia kristensenii]QAX80806.1 hypothetical protein D5F51_21120 [Yersinia hibernica]
MQRISLVIFSAAYGLATVLQLALFSVDKQGVMIKIIIVRIVFIFNSGQMLKSKYSLQFHFYN